MECQLLGTVLLPPTHAPFTRINLMRQTGTALGCPPVLRPFALKLGTNRPVRRSRDVFGALWTNTLPFAKTSPAKITPQRHSPTSIATPRSPANSRAPRPPHAAAASAPSSNQPARRTLAALTTRRYVQTQLARPAARRPPSSGL